MKLRTFPIVLAAVLLAAHFLRSYSLFSMLLSLLAPCLLFIKRRWSLVVLQWLTVPTAIIWLLTLNDIIQLRVVQGRSWTASAIILGTVTLFTLFAGWLLRSPIVEERYPSS